MPNLRPLVTRVMLAVAQLSTQDVERWGRYEVTLKQQREYGNPFTDVWLKCVFECGDERLVVQGFYDGEGIWGARLMPTQVGRWTYRTKSNDPGLDGKMAPALPFRSDAVEELGLHGVQRGTRSGGGQEQMIQRLASAGVNAFHCQMMRMRRCNFKGEGDDTHSPFVDHDPSKGLNEKVLDQWEGSLDQFEARGIIFHLEFYNDATDVQMMGWTLSADGDLHPEGRGCIDGIVNRFEHHTNIIWGVEKSCNKLPRNRASHFRKIAEVIAKADNHHQPIVQSLVVPNDPESDFPEGAASSDDYIGDPNSRIATWLHVVPYGEDLERQHLEHADLLCLVQGSQVIIDISGGHGGDDGRSDLRWIRYQPVAARMGAYVIVSNPVHEDTDFMGNSPWGGGSAVVRPDGSIQASRSYERDVVIVEDIDVHRPTRAEAKRRRQHPLFSALCYIGQRLLEGATVPAGSEITPYTSAVCHLRIAAAQMARSRDMVENIGAILRLITEASNDGADIVVFPELVLTGSRDADVRAATQPEIERALDRIRAAARDYAVHVIVGTPYLIEGERYNCAVVIGDDGTVKTCYPQTAASRTDLFKAGADAKALCFILDGVYSIVTIGDDANRVAIGDLAATRSIYLHFHLTYEADSSPDAAIFRRQRNLVALSYAKLGAVVNAADPS